MKSLVPDHDFSETHFRITHPIDQCPAGDLNTDADLPHIRGLRYEKVDGAKVNFDMAVKKNKQLSQDFGDIKENMDTLNYLNYVEELVQAERDDFRDNYNMNYLKNTFFKPGPAVEIETNEKEDEPEEFDDEVKGEL